MIWLWIGAALLLSRLVLGKKKISPEHYIWMLLPIDMYGFDVAGVTLKPYMIFAVFLVWLIWRRRESSLIFHFDRTWSMSALVLLLLVLAVNVMNNSAMSSFTGSVMVIVVFACAVIYISSVKPGTISQISDVMVATAIGFGVVFLVGTVLIYHGIYIGGMSAGSRMRPGMFLWFGNMVNGWYVQIPRLRGFMIDPNVLVCNFIYAIPAAVMNLAKGRQWIRSLLCLGVSMECVSICDSRMGILCAIFVIVAAVLLSYSTMSVRTRKWAVGLLAAAAVAVVVMGIFTNRLENFFMELGGSYDNRSSLTDEYGRLTLWGNALEALVENNPVFGVGLNQILTYTANRKETHNTWLEWICSSGVLIGGLVCLYFVSALVRGWVHLKRFRRTEVETAYLAIWLGAVGTFIALMSVDNVTNSYLWFGTMVLTAMWTRFDPNREETDGGTTDALSRTA